MKRCELCSKVARMYCNSDQASLCWDCDSRVHTANFLVAKHTRTLLCHACQAPTPWTSSGPKLSPTVSVCQACANRKEDEGSEEGVNDDDDDDDGENQVVPLSLSQPPSSASNSTSSEESSGGRNEFPKLFQAMTTAGSARFFHNGIEGLQENKSTQNIKTWRRR